MSQQSLKNQIANLQRKLSKVSVNGANRSAPNNNNNGGSSSSKRRQRRSVAGFRSGAGGPSPTLAVVAPKVQNTNPSGRGFPPSGTIRVNRRELLLELKQSTAGSVDLMCANLPWLSKLSACFDRIRWHRAILVWRPAVGTSTGGQLLMGPDWDSNISKVSATQVAALTPIYESPIWQGGQLALPSSRLMTRKEYFIRQDKDKKTQVSECSPCGILYSVTGTADQPAGHLWLDYDVTLFGTVSA